MKAIILAAGRGSRLKEHTSEKPKCLNTVGGRSLLEWQIDAFSASGIHDITIVTGYKSYLLENFGTRRIVNTEWSRSNMVQSLICAQSVITGPVIVGYSDILFGKSAVSCLMADDNDLAVLYDMKWRSLWERRFKNPLEDAESFRINHKGRILEIGKRVKDINKIAGQYVGLLRFTPNSLSWVKDLLKTQLGLALTLDMTALLNVLIKNGYPVYGVSIKNGWCEVDTPSDLEVANQMLKEGLLPLVAHGNDNA